MGQAPWDRYRTAQGVDGGAATGVEHGAGAVLAPGTRVGAWRIVELLGSGGMAHVYRAERADGAYAQEVALKLVRGRGELLARLRHERHIVAGLRHPHIVSLVDGGDTDDGGVWFAMPLVDGDTIDRHADARQLDWRARLRLFDETCAAVEYAHDLGLIHRDLKPANILVDPQGLPRLLDFGIAISDGDAGGNDHALTPGYAAPEQLMGRGASVASDVFQLGLVLRDLFHIDGARVGVPMPRAAAADLAALITRATATTRAARHAGVAALREDIARVLARRPLAGERRLRVRLARAVERHRLAMAVAVVAVLALVATITAAGLRLAEQRDLAQANAARADAVSRFLVDTLGQANPYAGSRGKLTVLDAMDHAAASLDAGLDRSPEVRRELRATIGNVYLNLDESRRCLDLLGSAPATADFSAAGAIERTRLLILRASCHVALDERQQSWRDLDAAEAALADTAGDEATGLRAYILVERGQLLSLDGHLDEADAAFERAIALADSIGERLQQYRARRMLGANRLTAGDAAAALPLLERAHAMVVDLLGAEHRSTLTCAGQLALAYARLERWPEADRTLQQALASAESIQHRGAGADIVVAQLRDNFATNLWQQSRYPECIAESERALALYQAHVPDGMQGFGPAWRAALCAYQAGDLADAETRAQVALPYAERGAPAGRINLRRLRATIAARTGRIDDARTQLAEADALLADGPMANPAVGTALDLARAWLAIAEGNHAAARTHLARADASFTPSAMRWLHEERDAVAARIGD